MYEYLLQAGGMLWVMNCLLFAIELKPSIAFHRYVLFLYLKYF